VLIAQITDLHFGAGETPMFVDNRERLACVLETLAALSTPPDLVLATGDLTESGDAESFMALKAMLDITPFRIHPLLGNHDTRAGFRAAFGDACFNGDYVQYTIEGFPLRIVVLDTLEPGRHGGAFDDARADWLDRTLAQTPEAPTVIALHHPPIETGISWITAEQGAPWVTRLRAVVEKHKQVVRLITGHVHRPIHTMWAGVPVSVCPATAAQVALDLAPIDPFRADGRRLVVAEPPGFSLHLWNGATLVSHVGVAVAYDTLASFDEKMADAMSYIMDAPSPVEPGDARTPRPVWRRLLLPFGRS
jgi:3',5'-cyclic AMP phosphodiesterase CpdA